MANARSIEIREVKPGFIVRTHGGDSAPVTDAQPVHHGHILFVTPTTFAALWPLISNALGLAGQKENDDG